MLLLSLGSLVQGLRTLSDFILPLSPPDRILFDVCDFERSRGNARWFGFAQGFSPAGGARSGEEGERCESVSEAMLRANFGCVVLVLRGFRSRHACRLQP